MFGGSGLMRHQGCVIFVPFSAPGDEVSLKITQEKKNFKIAQIEKILHPSPDRVSPPCPHFESCGGCQLQHLSYEAQLKAKRSFVTEALGKEIEIVPAPSPWHYRSHLRFNLRKEGKGFHYGFIATDNASLIEIQECPLFSPETSLFSSLKTYLQTLPNAGIQSASCRLFKEESRFILAFSFFPRLPKTLPPFPLAKGVAFKSPQEEIHQGNTQIKTHLLGVPVSFSPYGFMQNNLAMSEKLYQTVLDWVGPKPKKVLDLYCGVGITSTLLSRMGHDVIGVESNKEALKKGQEARFICAPVEAVLPKLLETFQPDVILVNPPRTGLSPEVRLSLKAPELLYISCMPATLKRDLQDLQRHFRIDKGLAFDMFPQTTHVETLVRLVI